MNELEIIRRYGPPALLTLTFALPMLPDADALAESDSLFFIRGADARFGFETDDTGGVAMVVFTDGSEIRLAPQR